MSQLVDPITTCRICGKQFVNDPMAIPIIGEPANAKTERYVMQLAQHIGKKHSELFAAMTQSGKMLMGFLALAQFDSQDRALNELREMIRYDIHRTTARVTITDDHIGKAIAELGIELQADDRQRIVNLIVDLRDLLSDSGAYSPKVNSPWYPHPYKTPYRIFIPTGTLNPGVDTWNSTRRRLDCHFWRSGMGKPSKIVLSPRKCKYCKATFTPKRVQDHKARFCEPNHRKDYYRYGGLPFDKLMARMDREIHAALLPITAEVIALRQRIESLEVAAVKRKRRK